MPHAGSLRDVFEDAMQGGRVLAPEVAGPLDAGHDPPYVNLADTDLRAVHRRFTPADSLV